MLDLQSTTASQFCDSLSRRRLLEAGGLSTLGLGLPDLLRSRAQAASASDSPAFGTAKRMILLFMWGGPAHQDTWDLKPEGPLESRGEFMPIGTNVPGIHISEHFPLLARHADKLAIVRSVGQEDNNHSTGAHASLTGRRHELKAESFAARGTDFPHFGSVVSALRPNPAGMPNFVALPEMIHTTNGSLTPGQFGGLIGRRFDPFQITDHPDRADFSIDALKLPADLSTGRMAARRDLMRAVDNVARLAERSDVARNMGTFYEQALEMVLSSEARRAFDLEAVPRDDRFRYGWHTFGQSVLMARRLIESGVQVVTVYWHREKKTIDTTWDTHALNFQELRRRLMPSVDQPIAALLEDLSASGLLDETLVVWNSEFGRTPKINANAGRDHWGPCNSVVFAGGGVPGGQVYGASDAQAAWPVADKVTQDDIAATIYHLLGYEPEHRVYDTTGRPHSIALGEPIVKLLGGRSRPEPTPPPLPLPERPPVGRFAELLRQRGNRYMHCDAALPVNLLDWELTGWSDVLGAGHEQHRRILQKTAKLKYRRVYYGHFAYENLVLLTSEPVKADDLAILIADTPLEIPAELRTGPPRRLWQIPVPADLTKGLRELQVQITAPGWPISDIALTGEAVRQLHIAEFLPDVAATA